MRVWANEEKIVYYWGKYLNTLAQVRHYPHEIEEPGRVTSVIESLLQVLG